MIALQRLQFCLCFPAGNNESAEERDYLRHSKGRGSQFPFEKTTEIHNKDKELIE